MMLEKRISTLFSPLPHSLDLAGLADGVAVNSKFTESVVAEHMPSLRRSHPVINVLYPAVTERPERQRSALIAQTKLFIKRVSISCLGCQCGRLSRPCSWSLFFCLLLLQSRDGAIPSF